MRFAEINDTTIRYRVSGDLRGPAVIFSNSLGTDLTIWDDVVERLPAGYAMIGYDKRGHGLSAMPTAPITIQDHAADLIALADHLGLASFVICGVSVGGMIAQAVAARVPERVQGLVLCNTGAKIGPPQIWNDRIAAIEEHGLAPMADAVMQRWFTPPFHQASPARLAGYRAMLTRTPAAGYVATCCAIRDSDLTETTSEIDIPTLCIAGEGDLATPPALVRSLAALIRGATCHEIPACGHIPSVEQPEVCATLISRFLAATEEHDFAKQPGEVATAKGMATRRKVLGDSHVDRALAQATPLDQTFQSFITAGAWGGVWSGRHFSLRERSIVTLGLLAAMGQDDELEMHLRATLNTGATPDDVAELMMHVAVYAGVPRANHALKIAKRVFAQTGEGGVHDA
ncbi:MAG: 3-oxoadipate enol-lactonase [Pseudomonadota bacterium]